MDETTIRLNWVDLANHDHGFLMTWAPGSLRYDLIAAPDLDLLAQ